MYIVLLWCFKLVWKYCWWKFIFVVMVFIKFGFFIVVNVIGLVGVCVGFGIVDVGIVIMVGECWVLVGNIRFWDERFELYVGICMEIKIMIKIILKIVIIENIYKKVRGNIVCKI